MSYGDNVREARNDYAQKYCGGNKAKANLEIDKALDEMEERFIPVTFTAEQMTKRIQKVDPFYHFDCSPENLARQKALHDKALQVLRHREIQHYREDPYSEMGRTVWGEDRSDSDYGPYVGRFMDKEAKEELTALTQMAKDGKTEDPEFIRRRSALHRKINLHAMSIADEKRKEYANLTTEQMLDRYDEIYTFCRLGDTTNCTSGNLTPDECTAYHEKMNPLLTPLGIAMNKISALAGPAGDRIDVDQLAYMSQEQLDPIRGQNAEDPDYLAQDGKHNLNMDPVTDLQFIAQNYCTKFQDHLTQKYDQFAIQYNDDPKGDLYASGFGRKLLFQNAEGNMISMEDAMEEMLRWHRPVFVSTGNHPEAAPVMAFMDKGVPYAGAEALQAFKNCDLHHEEQPPKFEPPAQLSGWQKFKMGFANFLESIPLLNINAQIFRDDDIDAYEEAKDQFDRDMRRYEMRQESRKLQDKADDLAAPGYTEMIQRKLLSEKPELLQKATENKAAQEEAKQQAKNNRLADDKKQLDDWAKEKNLNEDGVDKNFREKVMKIDLPLEEKKNLLTLHHVLRDEREMLRDDLTAHEADRIAMSDDQLRNAVADTITCYLAQNLLSSEVNKMVKNAEEHPNVTPKLSKELSELACINAKGDAATAIKNKLADQTIELRNSDGMKASHFEMHEVNSMLFGIGRDRISATKRMIARVNNNAQAAVSAAPNPQEELQAQKQAQNQQTQQTKQQKGPKIKVG